MIRNFISKISSAKWLLGLILLSVFILHIPGLFYGYPLKNNVGDEVTIMGTIFKMFDDHALRPAYASFYHLPMTVYLQIPFYLLLSLFLLGSGIFPDIESFRNFILLDYGRMLPFARLITALFATLSVYLIYRIVKKIGGTDTTALCAAFLLSFNLMFFQVTHFARAWSLQIALILLAVYLYVRWNEKENPKPIDYFFVALSTFLALGVHIVGGLVYIMFVTLFLYKIRAFRGQGTIAKHIRLFTLTSLSLVAGLGVYYLLHPGGVLVYLYQPGVERAAGAVEGLIHNLKYYTWIFFTYDTLLALLSIPSFIYLYIKKNGMAVALLSYIVLFTASISYAVHSEPRFIVSTMPFFVIPAAFFITRVLHAIADIRVRRGLLFALALIVLFLPLMWTRAIVAPNTLLSARTWIMTNVPADSRLIISNFYIDIPENRQAAQRAIDNSAIANTAERRAILTLKKEFLEEPRYFAVIDGKLSLISDKKLSFQYALISFSDRRERESLRSKLPKTAKLVYKAYPDEAMRDISDIASNMHEPFKLLRFMRMTGPYVEIYTLQ